jgi:hypothetical protein
VTDAAKPPVTVPFRGPHGELLGEATVVTTAEGLVVTASVPWCDNCDQWPCVCSSAT